MNAARTGCVLLECEINSLIKQYKTAESKKKHRRVLRINV